MIYIFGDSFSENLWPSMLTNDINTPHTNYAKSGCTNNDILHSIVSKLDYFKKNDIVIIQLSGQGRLNVGDKCRQSFTTYQKKFYFDLIQR